MQMQRSVRGSQKLCWIVMTTLLWNFIRENPALNFFYFRFFIFTVSCDIVNEKFGKFLKWFAGKFKREWIKHQEEGDLLAQQPNTEIWHFLIFLIWHFLMSECKRLVLKPFFLLLSREHVCCVLVWMIAALLVLLLHLLLLKFSICWGFLLVF